MNAIGIALVWCIVQVTVMGVLSGALYLIVRKVRPTAGAPVALSGLLAVVVLSALALSPWPRWSLDAGAPSASARAVPDGASASSGQNDPIALADGRSLQDRPQGKQDSSLSTAALFWRGLLEELSQTQPASETSAWRWPAVIAVLVLTAMAGGIVWLVLGILAVRWHRARSRPVDDAGLVALVNELRAELGCRRRVELRQSDDLVTAATIGWRRPSILLPPEWVTWTSDQRRAVLAHEMAHVRRNDFLAVLGGQLGVVLHFYHPLLHWLMGRLRLEQELAADAAAADVSGGQRRYLVTIAELALRQQDRALAWPARTFLPTRTTFLRRIAMLRDSRLRFERLSRPLRIGIVAAVAACGLLVAGLRGPAGPGPALADDPTKPSFTSADTAAVDTIDTTFLIENAASFIIMRPAAACARPELAELAKLLEDSPNNVVPKGTRLTDLRQITMILPEPAVPIGPREVVVFHCLKPLPAKFMQEEFANATVKDYEGRKMYLPRPPQTSVALAYDDRTLVTAGSEASLVGYMSGKRGVLPKWLPAKAWDSFRGDHFVVAADAATMRREMKWIPERAGPMMTLAPFSPLWEETAWLAGGARLDDRLAVHASLGAKDADAAVRVHGTLEAMKTLAQNTAKNTRTQVQAMPERERPAALTALDAADRLLANLKIHQEGDGVRLETSVEVRKELLDTFVQSIIAARAAAMRAQSMNNLKQLAIAMHNYADSYKHFPPAVLYGPDGKTPYSWRVALLPYLERKDLYDQYRFDEPWDGPNNGKLLDKIPAMFRSPTEPANSTSAAYFALVGPRSVFGSKEGTSFSEIIDGTSNTIMLVEAKRDIPWTKPEDIPFDPDKPVPQLGGFSTGTFLAALCDASVRSFRSDMPQDILRLLIMKDDNQPTDWDKVDKR